MPSIRRIHLQILMLCLLMSPGLASAVKFSVQGHGGTLGTGIGGTMTLIRHFNLRAGINSAEYNLNSFDIDSQPGLTYTEPKLELDNKYVYVDFYPRRRGKFRITLGAILNNNGYTASSEVQDINTFIGLNTAPIGTALNVRVGYDNISSYVGFGWGNSVSRGSPVGFGVDLGIMAQGDPVVDLHVNDPSGTVTQADAERERQELQAEVDAEQDAVLEFWPVVNFSLSYRF